MLIPPFIDAHLHFWDLGRHPYPWLGHEDVAHLRRNYLPSDWREDASGLPVAGTVHLQAEMDHALDPTLETRWLAELGDDGGAPSVCIGYADLASGDLDHLLDRHVQDGRGRFRGIRQEAWFDPASTRADVPTVNLLDDPAWARGLARLQALDLSFDLLVWATQLEQARGLFSSLPGLRVVVEHTGLPDLRSADSLQLWRAALRRFAAEVPQSVLKISAMNFITPDWTVEVVRPIVLEAIDIFGPSRCMFGSNYPVERGAASYGEVWSAYAEITAAFTIDERQDMFSGVAARIYRIASA